MYDKKHREWVIRDLATQYRILDKLLEDYEWMKDMAFALDNAIDSLDGIGGARPREVQTELLIQSNFMLTVALDMADGFGMEV